MRRLPSIFCLLVATVWAGAAWAAPASGAAETFAVQTATKVPGATLQAGTYSIKLVNRLSDRDILEIDSASGTALTTFIGIPNRKIPAAPGAKVVSWSDSADGVNYLRGWRPPGASAVTEFVYPKADAVAIAKVNKAGVPAIDPASEGRVADPTLSSEDMRLINLWLLSSTTVAPGSSEPAIKAERYQTASNSIPQPPPVKRLPHTASELPLLWLGGFSSLLLAVIVRRRRLGTERQLARSSSTR